MEDVVKKLHEELKNDFMDCLKGGYGKRLGITAKDWKKAYDQVLEVEYTPTESIIWSAGALWAIKYLLKKFEEAKHLQMEHDQEMNMGAES